MVGSIAMPGSLYRWFPCIAEFTAPHPAVSHEIVAMAISRFRMVRNRIAVEFPLSRAHEMPRDSTVATNPTG
ncbi:hypothetical protein [Actinomadura chokoriensis]|uniref:hypothetical protein n=1 Tax=Actinomadura chokoriensis TaxID=454156 RepID=UPI003562CA0A